MPVQNAVMARNLMDGPTVISSDPRGSQYVEWQGSNDPGGGDVQLVPEEIVSSVPFVRAIQRGILVIENPEDNPDLLERIDKQNAAFRNRLTDAREKLDATIERPQNRDMVTLPCVGPSAKGDGICGEYVTVRELNKNDKPPLCNRHTHLAQEYVPTEEAPTKWSRVQLGERERQQF